MRNTFFAQQIEASSVGLSGTGSILNASSLTDIENQIRNFQNPTQPWIVYKRNYPGNVIEIIKHIDIIKSKNIDL